ncbi:MAG: cbb3-type cytochrome c oxidase N-terminal domain-containing protein [Bdellovibrionota bacterium]
MSNQDEKLEKEISGHSYDGITECDNPMPDWWLWTFLLSIIFAALYFVHYESGAAPTLKEELNTALAIIEKQKQVHAPALMESEESLTEIMNDPAQAAAGAAAYASKCAVCHGNELQGQIGPNLVDNYWLHGRATRIDIVKVIREGVVDKGMPAWGQMVSQQEIYALTSFIISKRGSNPPQAKAPQGEAIE